jgi:hypothetical protein
MKNKIVKLAPLLLLPCALLLAGCWTNPYVLKPATGDPAFVGSMVIVNSYDAEATVESIDPASRQIILKYTDGTSTTNIAGPEIVNFDKIAAGDLVKAKIGEEIGIFLVKNGPLPTTTGGVMIQGAAKGANPAGVIVSTVDMNARVIMADRSYRMLTLKYANGVVKTFKVPLPYTLEHVAVGDDLVLRATQTIALHLVPKKH